jgi:C4-dicarboxylate-specific signal transduction histidine kinase
MPSPSISISGSPQAKSNRFLITVAILFATIAISMSFISRYGLGLTSSVIFLGGIAIAICAMIDATIFRLENALRNTRLYRDLHERDAQIRRMIDEQKRAEDALRRSEAHLAEVQAELAHVTRLTTLGELTASIAHEINQPLAAIVTNANASLRWLSGDAPNLAEARQAIRCIARDGNRAGEITSRIRALAKKAPPQKNWLDLNETIGEVMAIARSEAQRNRVSLQTQLANDLPLVLGDRIQLQQVMLNLLINAIEAMSEVDEGTRELWVSSEKVSEFAGESEEETLEYKTMADAESTHVLIAVRDSGPGLEAKDLDRLFDSFHTTKPQGLGMGLAISRSIVEAHEGRLWAAANVSRGAVFQFALPIRDQMPSAQLTGMGNALRCDSRRLFAGAKYVGEITSLVEKRCFISCEQ